MASVFAWFQNRRHCIPDAWAWPSRLSVSSPIHPVARLNIFCTPEILLNQRHSSASLSYIHDEPVSLQDWQELIACCIDKPCKATFLTNNASYTLNILGLI
jgi:hypothetical protein